MRNPLLKSGNSAQNMNNIVTTSFSSFPTTAAVSTLRRELGAPSGAISKQLVGKQSPVSPTLLGATGFSTSLGKTQQSLDPFLSWTQTNKTN